jgi:hypothetical protein
MKKRYLGTVTIIALLLLSVGVAQAGSVNNPGFESGDIGGWSTWCVTGDVASGVNHTPGGNYSASPSLNDPNGPFNVGGLIQEINVSPGAQVTASAWVKTEDLSAPSGGEVQAILKIEFWQGGNIIGAEEAGRISGTRDWNQVSLTTNVPQGTSLAKVILLLWNPEGTGNSGKVYFDDVEVSVK